MKIKISDIAKHANVSAATVSNVINGTRPVGTKSRELVVQAMKELGYDFPSTAKKSKSGERKTIGVILTSLKRIFFHNVLYGIQMIADRYGYDVLLYTSEDSFEKEKQFIDKLVEYKVNGIIFHSLCPAGDAEYLTYLGGLAKKKGIPVVSLERNLTGLLISSVYADNYAGARLAVRHLVECGAKRIACIRGPVGSAVAEDRFAAYCDVLEEYGMKVDQNLVCQGDFFPISGASAARRLLINGLHPDAIFACNDQMAIGTINVLDEYGLRIPDDVKIAGYDNAFVSSIVSPQLTTVNVPKIRMGEEAFMLLLQLMNQIEGGDRDNLQVYLKELPVDLVVRQSTSKEAKTMSWELEEW